MIALDTNVLLRFLVKDDLAQWQLADQLIREAKQRGEICFINHLVLCELIWVLKRAYKFNRLEIIEIIESLLKADIFEFENREAIRKSSRKMKYGKADFPDYLIGELNQQAGASETVTFDQKLKEADGFRVLA